MKPATRQFLSVPIACLLAIALIGFASFSPSVSPVLAEASPAEYVKDHVSIRYSQPNTILDNTDQFKNDRILAAIQDATNIDIEWDSSFSDYQDRIQTELIAGMAPDLFCNFGDRGRTSKIIGDGVVVNIGELIAANPGRYPVLEKMIQSSSYRMFNEFYTGDPDNTSAIYSLANVSSWAGASVYNADLLELAGFSEAPKTVDEFVEFTTTLGQQGISGWWPRNNKLSRLTEINYTLFAPNGTSVQPPDGDPWEGFLPVGGVEGIEGPWELKTISDETRDVLKILAEMYKTGALDAGVGTKDEFTQVLDEFIVGKIGAINFQFASSSQYSWIYDKWIQGNPDGSYKDLVMGTTLSGSAGMGVTYTTPAYMGFNFFIADTCENPERVLDLIEYLASDAGQSLIFEGIEGIHYTKNADGGLDFNYDEWNKDNSIYNVSDSRTRYVFFPYLFSASQQKLALETSTDWYETSINPVFVDTEKDTDAKAYALSVLATYGDKALGILPPYFNIIQFSDELNTAREQMTEITLRYVPSFITGQKDIDAEWDNYVNEYKAAGSDLLTEAFNTAKDIAKAQYENY